MDLIVLLHQLPVKSFRHANVKNTNSSKIRSKDAVEALGKYNFYFLISILKR